MKILYNAFIFSLAVGLSLSCGHHHHHHPAANPSLYATLYQQHAAEYRALCYQAFNVAELQLEEALKQQSAKPKAIITDIDETILDNSPYQAAAILGNFGYPERWAEWMNASDAWAVPGAIDFLTKAAAAGVKIVYVTNRKEEFRGPTLNNLRKLGFPNVEDDFLLMRQEGEGNEKEPRRQKMAAQYEVIMLLGDNLDDFSGVFEVGDAGERMLQTDMNKSEFGRKFIVLPNAIYGSWVNVLPGYRKDLPAEVLADSLLRGLMPF